MTNPRYRSSNLESPVLVRPTRLFRRTITCILIGDFMPSVLGTVQNIARNDTFNTGDHVSLKAFFIQTSYMAGIMVTFRPRYEELGCIWNLGFEPNC